MIDDFDELASAYLDGQTTNAEADRVETDPDLRSRVAAFGELSRALDTDVEPADPGGRSRHITAALDAFDARYGTDSADESSPTTPTTTTGDEASDRASDEPWGDDPPATRRLAAVDGDADRQAGGPDRHTAGADDEADRLVPGRGDDGTRRLTAVDDEEDRRAARPDGRAGGPGPSTFPTWLALAAVLLLVVGGFGVLSQIGGGDDDETASIATETADDSAADDSAGSDAAATTEAAELAATEEAVEDEGEDDEMAEDAEALDDEAATEEDSADDDASAEVPAADGEGSPAPSTTTTGGFFPEEAVEGARVPLPPNANPSELAALAEGTVLGTELSSCAPDGVFDGEIVLFFVPILRNETPGEVLFVEPPSEPRPILLDSDCQPVP